MSLITSSYMIIKTLFSGRALVHTVGNDVGTTRHEEISEDEIISQHEGDIIPERLLRMNTKDYGRYDPAPALVKPPFKLIPN